MEIIELISAFKRNNSMLWVENNNIQLFVSDGYKSQDLKNTITRLKVELRDLLLHNKIFSKEDFLKMEVFRFIGNKAELSFAQERLWFIEQFEEGSNAYHIPALYELSDGCDKNGLIHALKNIAWRHEVLRSTIELCDKDKNYYQVVHDKTLYIDEITLLYNQDYESEIKWTVHI